MWGKYSVFFLLFSFVYNQNFISCYPAPAYCSHTWNAHLRTAGYKKGENTTNLNVLQTQQILYKKEKGLGGRRHYAVWGPGGKDWLHHEKMSKALSPLPLPSSQQSPNFQTFKEPKNWFQGTNYARMCSLADRYDNHIPTRFIAPIDCFTIPALNADHADHRGR